MTAILNHTPSVPGLDTLKCDVHLRRLVAEVSLKVMSGGFSGMFHCLAGNLDEV